MTDAEYIQLLEDNNRLLMGLLGDAIRALPLPRIRELGDAPSPRYWPDSVISRILGDVVIDPRDAA
jgi:hypothetical protein